jgi:hypothetical protein
MLLAKTVSKKMLLIALLFLATMPMVQAQNKDTFDAYKWRVTGMWWFSHPSGSFNASTDQVSFDLNRDFGFGNYSTFTGKIDFHFKRKHHLVFAASPITSSKTRTLNRDITFRGVTYAVGAQVSIDVKSLSFSPGYQWDIFRRNHGYLALLVAVNLLDTQGTLTGIGSANGVSSTYKRSGSVFAPLPTLGPRFRWYPLRNSARLSLDGSAQGMYFFGYGDFVSAQGTMGIAANHRLSFRAGYQMGTRLTIHGSSNQVGVRLTQKGPVAGIELSW